MAVQEVVEERAGYKKTKLGWIPEDWKLIKLKAVANVKRGAGSQYLKYCSSTDANAIRLIRIGDFLKNESKFIEATKDISRFLIKEGDLLIAGTGATAGIVFIVPRSFNGLVFSYNAPRIRIEEGAINRYLYYFLKSNMILRQQHALFTGNAQPFLDTRAIEGFNLFVPKLKEQKAIANCLSTWDNAIEKQTQLIQAKQTQKKALMQQLLTGKKRLPGFTEEWKEKSLTYFLDYTPRPITKPNIPFTKLGIRSHCKGTFQNKNFKPEAIAIDKLFEVKKNDLIINITFAWEGAIAIVKQEDDGGLVSHRFPTYTFKKNIGSSLFFEQFIKTKRFRFLLELISPGGAGRNRVMSKKDFLKLKITIPKYKEQTAIANILNTADKEIELLQKQLTQLQEQKKGVMQQLLTGKKRLKF